MGSPVAFRDDYALVFQQQIRAFRESLDSEATTSKARAEDRISKLPDEVLHHILSFIPTKQIVRTSILSTRWKGIWAYVPNWTLNSEEFSSTAEFIAFVDRALLIRDSAAIQKFHLDFDGCLAEDFSTIDRWICTAVRCKVVDLALSIETANGEGVFELPESLLTCKTLKFWKLSSNYNIKIPSSWCYQSLKSLHIKFCNHALFDRDNNSMDISHCPVLEYLKISGCFGFDNLNCHISAPVLKTLRICLRNQTFPLEANNYLINAPKLEKLDINEEFLSNYTFGNIESLVEANIDVSSQEDDEEDASAHRATKFLAGISGVKYLTLPSHFSPGCSVAAFENLSKLTLVCGDLRWWTILLKFLERSPNLECLVINDDFDIPAFRRVEEEKVIVHTEKKSANLGCFVFYYERRIHPHEREELVFNLPKAGSSGHIPKDIMFWSPPTLVPKCLLTSLKTISIHGFRCKEFFGYLDDMELIKYLLKHGRVLEKMAIHIPHGLLRRKYTPADCFWSGTKAEFCDEIAMAELGSKNVQVELIQKMLYREEHV